MNGMFMLWPMIVPLVIPLLYTYFYKKTQFAMTVIITSTIAFIIVTYPFLISLSSTIPYSYPLIKLFLFVITPLIIIRIASRTSINKLLPLFGIQKKNIGFSVKLAVICLPIMIGFSFFVYVMMQPTITGSIIYGIISFFESFTEEFFFRGILFLFLLKKTKVSIAYSTSLLSFILMHPQHFFTWFLIITIIQGILTTEIARRSNNIIGSWILHGTNRLLWLTIFPFFFAS